MNDYHNGNDDLDIHGAMDDHSRSWLKVIVPIMLLVVIGFITYAWVTDKFTISHVDANVPVIHADAAPVRTKPQDPGGMVIPGRDKMVYGHISKDRASDGKEVTHFMPIAEEPISRGTLMQEEASTEVSEQENEQSTESSMKKLNLDTNEQAIEEEPIEPEAHEQAPGVFQEVVVENTELTNNTENKEAPNAKKLDLAQANPDEVKKEIAAPKPVEKTKITASDLKKSPVPIRKGEVLTLPDPSKKHGNYIQLGSFRNQTEVVQEWQKVKKAYPDLLKKLNYISEKADLKEQGVFYRLQVGPFKTERDARKLCQELTDKKQRCFFVK
jgi:cell division septation protein DedD